VRSARVAAVLTWLYAAGFGLFAIPVSAYLQATGRLPSFFGMFDMYGGAWSGSTSDETFSQLLYAFLALQLVVAWSGWLLWRGERRGAILNLLTLPAEAVFWVGFALPLPWVTGIARIMLLAVAWRSLDGRRTASTPGPM
jgi:hypothetical protein